MKGRCAVGRRNRKAARRRRDRQDDAWLAGWVRFARWTAFCPGCGGGEDKRRHHRQTTGNSKVPAHLKAPRPPSVAVARAYGHPEMTGRRRRFHGTVRKFGRTIDPEPYGQPVLYSANQCATMQKVHETFENRRSVPFAAALSPARSVTMGRTFFAAWAFRPGT